MVLHILPALHETRNTHHLGNTRPDEGPRGGASHSANSGREVPQSTRTPAEGSLNLVPERRKALCSKDFRRTAEKSLEPKARLELQM